MALDFDLLKETDAQLSADLAPYVKSDGTFKFMPPALVERLQTWVVQHPDFNTRRKICEKQLTNDIDAQQAKLKADNETKAQLAAAIARLEQYGREQGLTDSDQNIREIKNFIESSHSLDERLRGKWTPVTVDLAVGYLAKEGRLEFRKQPATPPAAPKPAETLVTLSDGSRQLSLDQPCPRNATVAQAKDYLQRIRKQQQPNVTIYDDGLKIEL